MVTRYNNPDIDWCSVDIQGYSCHWAGKYPCPVTGISLDVHLNTKSIFSRYSTLTTSIIQDGIPSVFFFTQTPPFPALISFRQIVPKMKTKLSTWITFIGYDIPNALQPKANTNYLYF